jgi:hypothetical protein
MTVKRPVPASEHGVECDNELLLLLGEVLVFQVGPQVVGVPQPAALAAPLQPCSCKLVVISRERGRCRSLEVASDNSADMNVKTP